MELKTLQELINTPQQLLDRLRSEKPVIRNPKGVNEYAYTVGLKQYDPQQHAIKDLFTRPDWYPNLPNGEVDSEGRAVLVRTRVARTRMAIPIQQYIIDQRASFAVGGKLELKPNVPDSPVYQVVLDQWKRNKIHFLLKDVARRMMAETEAAVIFYSDPKKRPTNGQDLRLRVKVVSPSSGSILHPVFDDLDDFIAFGREYEIDDKKRLDLYTADELIKYQIGEGRMEIIERVKLPYNSKMPVIYWHQDRPECANVQDIIEAREAIQSDFFDTNLRIGDPIMVATSPSSTDGHSPLISLPPAGTPGKVIEASGGADVKFISPADATQARELEFKMLDDLIFSLTRTVKLSPENLKGLGIESGAAMDRILIASHMAAKDMQDGEFGMGVQRMLNFLTHVYSYVLSDKSGLEIEPVFSLFRVEDAKERVELARLANGDKPVIDHVGSIRMAGISDDPEATYDMLIDEEPAPAKPAPNVLPIGVAK